MEEDEEEEVISHRGSEKMSKSRKEEFSPVDKFNMELLKAKDWENPQTRQAQLPDKLPTGCAKRSFEYSARHRGLYGAGSSHWPKTAQCLSMIPL